MKQTTFRLALAALLCLAASGPATAHPANGLVQTEQGEIYIADISSGVVWRYANAELTSWLEDIHTHHLALGPEGKVWGEVHDSYGDHIRIWELYHIEDQGKRVHLVPPSDGSREVPGLLRDQNGVHYGPMFAPEPGDSSHIWRWEDGHFHPIAGGPRGHGDGSGLQARFGGPGVTRWAPDSSILIIDRLALRRMTRSGEVSTLLRNHPSLRPPSDPRRRLGNGNPVMDILEREDGVYFTNFFQGVLYRLNPEGKVEELYRSRGAAGPIGLYDGEDGLLILEVDHPHGPPRLLLWQGAGDPELLVDIAAAHEGRAHTGE